MILQALCDYYQRQQNELPQPGFERKAIPFIIVLDRNGGFVDLEDTRSGDNKRDKGRLFVVPQGVKRTVGIAANLLWDGMSYVLGAVSAARAAKLDAAALKKEQARARETHAAFLQRIHEVFPAPVTDEGIRATLTFLERGDFSSVFGHPLWAELNKTTESISLRLEGDLELICQREAVRQAIMAAQQSTASARKRCLVSGKLDAIARLHPAIKGVRGAQSSGANLFSFNFSAACSHGKEQGQNAPVGEYAAFAYTTSLNTLLRADSRQRLSVGEDTFVFWAEKPDPAEELFAAWLQPDPDDPARGVEAIKALYQAPTHSGARPLNQDDTRFFVLGLAPNNARLAVRLWSVSTVRELAGNIRRHFDDLAIVRPPRDPEFLPVWRLLVAIAAQGKSENVPPLLAGEVLQCGSQPRSVKFHRATNDAASNTLGTNYRSSARATGYQLLGTTSATSIFKLPSVLPQISCISSRVSVVTSLMQLRRTCCSSRSSIWRGRNGSCNHQSSVVQRLRNLRGFLPSQGSWA